MASLNPEQKRAVCHTEGPMLVLAGPGSGKTTVITHRIKHLIMEKQVCESNILVITFTKAAANEMKSRFSMLMQRDTEVIFGTFHSVFFQILRQTLGYDAAVVIKETERYKLIRDLITKYQMHYDGQDAFAACILSEFGLVKGKMLDIKTYCSRNMKQEDFRLIYTEYEKELRKRNLIDFDDMLVMCYRLLCSRQDILESLRNRFLYILIDEFQDINRIQYEIVRLLAGNHGNLFAVGDDDQSIYSFRGSDPGIMLGFAKDFPKAETVYLCRNYRCSYEIVKASKRLIENNQNRYEKQLLAASGQKNGTEGLHVITVDNPKEEYEDICNCMLEMKKQQISWKRMAVLYRTNTEPELLMKKLTEYNIPFQIKDGIPDLFQHFAVQDIMAYLKLAAGEKNRTFFLRILNKPDRCLPREIFWEEQTDWNRLYERLEKTPEALCQLELFKQNLDRLAGLRPYAAINYIRKGMGYDDYIREFALSRGIDAQEYLELFDTMMDMAKTCSTYQVWFRSVRQYQETVQEKNKLQAGSGDMVTLATMHGAKGLEFDRVWILNAAEGRTPHKKAVKEGKIEEERRMFYVAVTRARQELYIYVPKEIHKKPVVVSRFVTEMIKNGTD